MGKYKKNFFQVSREPFSERSDYVINELSLGGFKLYIWLHELEHRYSGRGKDFFFRSNKDLAQITGMNLNTIKKGKRELKEYGLIETFQIRYVNPKTGKKSYKHVTAYRILSGKVED